MTMGIGALCFLCLVLGLVIGYEWADWRDRKKQAPVPVIPEYDINNPMNGMVKRDRVIICGREWDVIKPGRG